MFCLPCCATMVLLGMHRSNVASTSPRALAILSKSPSSEGVAVLMKVAFHTSAAGIRESARASDFVRVSIFHRDRSFDGGRVGLAVERRGLSVCSSSTAGRPPVSKRQVKRREGRHFHLSHRPPRSTRTSTHNCSVSWMSRLLCSRRSKWSSVRKNGAPRPEWQHLLVCSSADHSSAGIRLCQASIQDKDFQEKNPGHVLGARGRCANMRRKIQWPTGRL